MKAKWLGAALVFAAVGGCDTTNNTIFTTPDMAGAASPAPACTPNAKECVSSTLARVCPADGSGWLAVQCQNGETCNAGDCGLDVNTVACLPSDSFCTSDTTALICNDNGMGLHMKTCPANTHCINSGDCFGSCVVGSFVQCFDNNTALNCNDGFQITPSPCPAGQACSDMAGGCAPAACTPGACSFVCGNKAIDPASSDPNFFSLCEDTPFGFKWVSVGCTAPATCDQTAACNAQALSDACTTECTKGAIRCVDATTGQPPDIFNGDLGTGQQTCGDDGKWGPTVVCDVTQGKVCVFDGAFKDLGCGDTICGADLNNSNFQRDGICVLDAGVSKLRACDNSGNLVSIDRLTTCDPGTCLTDNNAATDPTLGVKPGHCGVECQMGDTRCDVNFQSSIQGCAANGTWSNMTTQCTAPKDFCLDGTQNGRPHAACVVTPVCDTGDTRCTNGAGVTAATGTSIETCDATGQWASPMPCVASHCDDNPNSPFFPTKLCIADCIAGKQLCLGAAASSSTGSAPSPIPAAFGTKAHGVCTSDGHVDPSPTPCPSLTACRMGPDRVNALGCVLCASVNEAGVADTRCSPTNPANIEVCNATNNGFTLLQMCTGGATCQDPEDPRDANPETCTLTESSLKSFDPTDSCDNEFGDGPAIACGGKPDCCASWCNAASSTSPAVCF